MSIRSSLRKWGFRDEVEIEQIVTLACSATICSICGKHTDEVGTLHVDHNHNGHAHFRGMLCSRCNVGIGQFLDDPDLLAAAARYLISHSQS
ncbi:MAG: endonuclease domain-containing protein [Candidatus Thorarchaeota archaeon]